MSMRYMFRAILPLLVMTAAEGLEVGTGVADITPDVSSFRHFMGQIKLFVLVYPQCFPESLR